MVILTVHNSYQQPGGEDEVFRHEAQLLESYGHQVVRCASHNDEVVGKGAVELLRKTIYNPEAYGRIRSLIQKHRPNLMHVHNTFPLLSPSVYYAAAHECVPVVQTLHNYRLLCPAGTLFRENSICEDCLTKAAPWPAVLHGCYRNSRRASAASATMLTVHRALKTFSRKVTTFIALSEFARAKFVQAGFPKEKLEVKPNFIQPDLGKGEGSGDFCIFAGRLTPEKGVRTLLEAWLRFAPGLNLEIAGDGDLAGEVAAAAARCPRIRWHGRLSKPQLYDRMRQAAALIMPSTWYEPFGVVLVEAFSLGLPVIASKLGAIAHIVEHGRTGLLFAAGDASDLAAQVSRLHLDPRAALAMRGEARLEFERNYTGERNYSILMDIYRKTMERFVPERAGHRNLEAVHLNGDDELVQIEGQRSRV